jgi:hypothetical protein
MNDQLISVSTSPAPVPAPGPRTLSLPAALRTVSNLFSFQKLLLRIGSHPSRLSTGIMDLVHQHTR